MKEKVLVFNGYYIPAKNYGGPTASLATIVHHCGDAFDFYIVAANHDLNETKVFDNIHAGWNQVGKAKVLYVDLSEINYHTKRIKRLLIDLKPDLVWLMGILVPDDKWFVSKACRDLNIPYLISPRGEVCEGAFHIKYYKKSLVAFLSKVLGTYKNAWYHATSSEEKDGLIKYFRAEKDRIFLVPNISSSLCAQIREVQKESGQLRVVFISRIHYKKNLQFAIHVVKKLNCKTVFDIYGPIEESGYWERCNKDMEESPNNICIRYCGALERENVTSTFSKYDCFLFPTQTENYGHVIAEALSVCCPVVLSEGTTPWDDLNECAGYICDLNDENQFIEALNRIGKMDAPSYRSLMESTCNYYNKKMKLDNAVQGHIDMIKKILGHS